MLKKKRSLFAEPMPDEIEEPKDQNDVYITVEKPKRRDYFEQHEL